MGNYVLRIPPSEKIPIRRCNALFCGVTFFIAGKDSTYFDLFPKLDSVLIRNLFQNKEITVFSDTRKQAIRLMEFIKSNSSFSFKYEIAKRTSLYVNYKDSSHYTKIYFYSAPATMHLLLDPEFLPIRIQPDKKMIEEGFITSNYLLFKDSTDIDIDRVSKCISSFHNVIFHSASESPILLREVFQAYNQHLLCSNPRSVFPEVFTFAKCLSFHDNRVNGEDNYSEFEPLRNYASILNASKFDTTDNYGRERLLIVEYLENLLVLCILHKFYKIEFESVDSKFGIISSLVLSKFSFNSEYDLILKGATSH
jgi:hypothetical protein